MEEFLHRIKLQLIVKPSAQVGCFERRLWDGSRVSFRVGRHFATPRRSGPPPVEGVAIDTTKISNSAKYLSSKIFDEFAPPIVFNLGLI